MVGFFVLLCVACLFAYYDLSIRFMAVFGKGFAARRLDGIMKRGPHIVFGLVKLCLGFKLSFEGSIRRRLPDQFLIIANHQSIVDIPILLYYFGSRPLRFVAKKELERGVPFISQILSRQEHCLVQRKGNMSQAMRALSLFAENAKRHVFCPVIFPEGTRAQSGSMRNFHSAGVRKILEAAPMPVLAIAMDGGYHIATLRSLFSNLERGHYRVRVIKVFDAPRDKKEINAMLGKAHALIKAQVEAWRREEGGKP